MLKQLMTAFLLLPALCTAAPFIEGKDYQVLPYSQHNTLKTPLIQEFFSYACPWCYKIEAPLTQWLGHSAKHVQFERIPVVFKPSWELYAKAFYTANTLALSSKLSPLLFKAIQEEHQLLDSKQAMIQFFTTHGVDREIAKSAFENSPIIDMKVQNGMKLMANDQIHAVPAFVVNNKYKTDLQMAGGPERLLDVLEFLLQQ